MLRHIQTKFSALSRLLVLALAVMLLIPAVPAQAASRTPGKVTLSSVTASGSNKVTIKWKKASNATQYRIYWKEARAKSWKTLANVSASKTSYTHTSNKKATLKGGKKYTYTVRAYNKYGKKWSSYNKKGKTVTIPTVPSIVKTRVKANNYKQTTVTWTKSINATNYLVYYRSADTTKWTRIANVSSKTLKYVHKSSRKYPVEAGKTYYYMVRGYNKTFKTYGGYSKTGTRVAIPEKPVATPTATPTVEPTATPKPDSQEQVKKDIKEVIRLTNKVRKKYGKNAVKESAALDAGAAVRAKEIYTKFSHERPDGTNNATAYHAAGAGNILGENITTGSSPERAVELWEESKGHLVTLIDKRATHIGVGYYKGFWVQVFAENPDQKFTLTIDANGGYFPDKGGVEKYTIQVPAGMILEDKNIKKPIRDGYTFSSWAVIYDDGYEIPSISEGKNHMNENKLLKANWTDNNSSD